MIADDKAGRGYNISPEQLYNFMNKHNISFIIRGHQDFPYNSFLYTDIKDSNNYDRYRLALKSNMDRNIDYIYYNKEIAKHDEIGTLFANGPIARVNCDKGSWFTGKFGLDTGKGKLLYPVLTISTNTDKEREMVHDSFAVLRFDLNEILHDVFINDNKLFENDRVKTLREIGLGDMSDIESKTTY